jgi:hypothetical protein
MAPAEDIGSENDNWQATEDLGAAQRQRAGRNENRLGPGRPRQRIFLGVPGAGYIAVPNISGTKPRTTISARASVPWCRPREARWSSGPPIEKPEPGAPRVLGSGIELDADLRDRVPLHVAHD